MIFALAIVLLARSVQLGPEIELAFDVRKMAIEAIQADGHELKDTVNLLVPTVLSIMRGPRSKKAQG